MMATWSRWIFICILLTSGTHISGEDCFDFICYYSNNCESGLNNVTGDCNICNEGWSGKKCQKQNVALKKPIFVDLPRDSGTNYDIIVDGITTQDKTFCIKEYRLDVDIYLDVNWKSLYYIKEVSIYYMKGAIASFRGFSVYMGNSSDVNEGVLCYQHGDEPLQDITTIPCNNTGQYLKIKNSRSNPPYPTNYSTETDLQICEIQAFTCARNTFGENCEGLCHCYGNDTCDPFVGICPGSDGDKCNQGWVGNSCDQRCENKYGSYCDKQCSLRQCKGTSSCNTFDGKCETGCKPGYRGIDCLQACISGTFGDNCQQTCHCYSNDVCHHVTGICPGTGRLKCEEGWSGDSCDQDCAGKYGTSCVKQCTQRQCKGTSSCNSFDGKCESGCKPGYLAVDCTQACISGTFGDNCQQTCHCYSNDVCHHVTGICPGTGRLKCEEGWSGDSCDQDCAGKYGTSCVKQCTQRQCKGTSSCNSFNGKCESGCKPGYLAVDCTQECSFGTYGDACSKQCSGKGQFCDEVGCDHVTGVCKGGCQSGWLGNSCNEECQVGLYGVNCMFNCSARHCINMTECNSQDGSCNGDCEDGWSGVDCVQECPVNYYGTNCTISCEERNCKINSTCNTNNGECIGGCLGNFIGLDCIFTEPEADRVVQDNGLDRLYVGLIGVFCGLVFCIILAIIIYLLCRSRWRRKLLVSERRRTKEVIYDDIPDLPPNVAVNNDLYDEPSTQPRSYDNLTNRPLPKIVVDSSSGSNLVRAKQNDRESRPYVNQTDPYERVDETNDQSLTKTKLPIGAASDESNQQRPRQAEPSSARQPPATNDRSPYIDMARCNQALAIQSSSSMVDEPNNQTEGVRRSALEPKEGDTDSISTVGSCCSDKLKNEQNEVSDAAENVQKRKENEYVKMGEIGRSGADTNTVPRNTGEGFVNRSFSD